MFSGTLDRMGRFLIELAARETCSAAKPPPPGTPEHRQGSPGRAREVAAKRKAATGKVLAGAVQFVGMDEIRETMGRDWERVADCAHAIAERAVRQELSGEDAYDRREDGSYVLYFADRSRAEADAKATRIVAQIKRQLSERLPDAKSIRVEHQVCELDWEEGEDGTDILEGIAQSLRRVREEAWRSARHWRRVLLQESRVLYQPLWAAKRRTVPLYRCLIDDVTGKAALERLTAVSDKEQVVQTLSELDCAILGRAVEGLHALRQNNGMAALTVPICFRTVNELASRQQFAKVCGDVPEAYRRLLLIELHSIPRGTPASRLLEVRSLLKPFCRSVLLQTALDEKLIAQLGGNGFFGVSLDAAWFVEQQVEAALYLGRYAKQASAVNLAAVAHGINTAGLLEAARQAGFDYLAGDAVAHTMPAPRGSSFAEPLCAAR
jgi:hypothetical protein